MTDDELIAELQRALSEAEAEEAAAALRKAKLARAIAVLGEIEVVEVPPATQALRDDLTPERRAERTAAGTTSREVSRSGNRRSPPELAAVPDETPTPDERPPLPQFSSTPQVPGHHFECDSCDQSYPTTRELTTHTIDVHGRRTNATERIPRAS